MKRLSVIFVLIAGLIALVLWRPSADGFEGFYDANCTTCHSATVNTCNGCHAHGVHSSDAKDDINVTGVTDKATYAPGETVTVTITGGYRTGWLRALLYDQNMAELARSSCPGGQGGCTTSVYPVTLTSTAPMTPGTYTWNVSWYGHQFDADGAFFQSTCSDILTTNCWKPSSNTNHGEEIVSTNSFEVASAAAPDISLDPSTLDFGTVNIGNAPTLPTQVQNIGTADLTVTSIALCAGTSTEFTWTPPSLPLIIAAGSSETLSVVYTPTGTGIDTGCLEIASNDPDTPTATLNVTGSVLPTETACFDSTDNDSDGLTDCADPDCAGASNGPCDTGIPGVCATGQTQCVSGAAECVQTVLPSPETIAVTGMTVSVTDTSTADTCSDGLDNDCDGLVDAVDPGCQVAEICDDSIDNDADGLID
ncbi:MAG: choice-of-anchor D domain-containing protein, partial [Thermodesulfovibrionales bacterium]